MSLLNSGSQITKECDYSFSSMYPKEHGDKYCSRFKNNSPQPDCKKSDWGVLSNSLLGIWFFYFTSSKEMGTDNQLDKCVCCKYVANKHRKNFL